MALEGGKKIHRHLTRHSRSLKEYRCLMPKRKKPLRCVYLELVLQSAEDWWRAGVLPQHAGVCVMMANLHQGLTDHSAICVCVTESVSVVWKRVLQNRVDKVRGDRNGRHATTSVKTNMDSCLNPRYTFRCEWCINAGRHCGNVNPLYFSPALRPLCLFEAFVSGERQKHGGSVSPNQSLSFSSLLCAQKDAHTHTNTLSC